MAEWCIFTEDIDMLYFLRGTIFRTLDDQEFGVKASIQGHIVQVKKGLLCNVTSLIHAKFWCPRDKGYEVPLKRLIVLNNQNKRPKILYSFQFCIFSWKIINTLSEYLSFFQLQTISHVA